MRTGSLTNATLASGAEDCDPRRCSRCLPAGLQRQWHCRHVRSLSAGTSLDCNSNLTPDECDLAGGTSLDCNSNLLPDECDLQCGASLDCNLNLIPDECDIASGSSLDCDQDDTPDECQPDCDGDGLPDPCETDVNGNGTPDECELFIPVATQTAMACSTIADSIYGLAYLFAAGPWICPRCSGTQTTTASSILLIRCTR